MGLQFPILKRMYNSDKNRKASKTLNIFCHILSHTETYIEGFLTVSAINMNYVYKVVQLPK